jgi:hypothetical protein
VENLFSEEDQRWRDGDGMLRSGWRWRVEEWMTMALRGMATATAFRDGCQRWYLRLQKPRDWGKGEWREWIFFCFFREFAGFFEVF